MNNFIVAQHTGVDTHGNTSSVFTITKQLPLFGKIIEPNILGDRELREKKEFPRLEWKNKPLLTCIHR